MAYSELVKSFENIRAYMREFYVYGFKSRSEYNQKSARSYDNERRRIESWLGGYMGFRATPEGKNVFLSLDSRVIKSNPFYKAWKAKSFTDGDITLHFIIFDILYSKDISLTLSEIIERADSMLSVFDFPMTPDESTLRKKLAEYVSEGIIIKGKRGKSSVYSRAQEIELAPLADAVSFFSEAAPCGVIGSFIADKMQGVSSPFNFKHHYITPALDMGVMAAVFSAMREKRSISFKSYSKKHSFENVVSAVPLKVFISTQNGRQHLIAYDEKTDRINAHRLDNMSNIKSLEPCRRFDEYKALLKEREKYIWGVNCRLSLKSLERVEFEIAVSEGEEYIVRRLEREKRGGRVEKIDENRYLFSAEVFDTSELIPWIRTFICRITRLSFSNRTAENQFKNDILEMYKLYGIEANDAFSAKEGENR